MDRTRIPPHVLHVCATLRRAGYQAYVVGGGVRDALRGKRPKDWDVATDALPDMVQRLFPKTVPTGIRFGTVTVLPGEAEMDPAAPVEVTTFRGDVGYGDGRRPDEVRFLDRIEDDLVRRDFTVNAIAFDPATDRLIDPYGGRDDLARKLIRAVGDADARFEEDGLRVLRAVRLAVELTFCIETETGDALRRHGGALERISRERIGAEWRRILLSDAPGRGLRLLSDYGLFPYVFLSERDGARSPSAAAVEAAADALQRATASDIVARTAIVLYGMGSADDHRRWLHGLVYPKRHMRDVLHVVESASRFDPPSVPEHRWLRRFLSALGRRHVDTLFDVLGAWRPGKTTELWRRQAGEIADSPVPLSIGELAVNGSHIQRLLGMDGGPGIGRLLERALDHVLDFPEDNDVGRLHQLLISWADETGDFQ